MPGSSRTELLPLLLPPVPPVPRGSRGLDFAAAGPKDLDQGQGDRGETDDDELPQVHAPAGLDRGRDGPEAVPGAEYPYSAPAGAALVLTPARFPGGGATWISAVTWIRDRATAVRQIMMSSQMSMHPQVRTGRMGAGGGPEH